jgi:hypothetical protein
VAGADHDHARELAQSGAGGRERHADRDGQRHYSHRQRRLHRQRQRDCRLHRGRAHGTGNSRTAACTTSSLAVGTHPITASYAGDAGNAASGERTVGASDHRSGACADHDHARELAQSGAGGRERHADRDGQRHYSHRQRRLHRQRQRDCRLYRGIALTGTGNSRTAACTTSSLAVGTHPITASYAGDAGNAASASAALAQVITVAAPASSNVALASAGGVASASSTYAPAYPVSAVNNNERAGTGWGNGGGWADGTPGAFPDWVQITFNGSKTLDRVVVYSLQDLYTQPVEPTDTTTFATYGITAFTVQGWNGASWIDLATVSNNTLVKRTVTFPAYPPTASASTSPPPAAPAPTSPRSKPGPRPADPVGPAPTTDHARELAQIRRRWARASR